MKKDLLKEMKKRKIVTTILTIVSISLMIGSFSYAWLNGVFTSNETISITAGTLNIVYNEEDNLISLINELPKLDTTAIANNPEHTFSLSNSGTENVGYVIRLQNICSVGEDIQMCVPNTYIKIALKTGSGSYVTSSLANSDIIARGTIAPSQNIEFSLKMWLDQLTPNIYNSSTTSNNIVYQSKIVLTSTQQLGTLVSSIEVSLSNPTVNVGSQIGVEATVLPLDARDTSYTWSSTNPAIAIVEDSGTIIGVSPGATNICAIANDGGNAYDCVEVTVLAP